MPTQRIIEEVNTRFTRTVKVYVVLRKEATGYTPLEPLEYRNLSAKFLLTPGQYVIMVASGRPDGEVSVEVKEAELTKDGELVELRGATFTMFPESCRENAKNELLRDLATEISEALFHKPILLPSKTYQDVTVDEVFRTAICA